MRPHPPACCKAVQRRILSHPDFVWISDDVLSKSFRRFASSVPGPMESRRRLGKRRMTQLSESLPSPISQSGGLWGLYPEVDRTQWRWEPPKRQDMKQEAIATALPAWLLDLDETPQGEKGDATTNDLERKDLTQEAGDGEDLHLQKSKRILRQENLAVEDIQYFRESIRNAISPQDIEEPYSAFLHQLKQCLLLGLVCGGTLDFALHGVTRDLRDASARWQISPDQTLSSFYTSVWEGISACKILGPVDFDAKVVDSLLSLLLDLPFTEKMQNLACSILLSTSAKQHLGMEPGIRAMVITWSHSWLKHIASYQTSLQTAAATIDEADHRLGSAQEYMSTLQKRSKSDEAIFIADFFLSNAQSAISLASNAISEAEHILHPLNLSTRELASTLDNLPSELLRSVIPFCSDIIEATYIRREDEKKTFRYYWLSTVAQSRNCHGFFLRTWQKIEGNGTKALPFSESECCNLILNHWVSRGLVTRAVEVTTCFQGSDQQDFASLLFALDKYRQSSLTRGRDLFLLLDDLGKLSMVFGMVSRMVQLGLKLPVTQVRLLLELTVKYDINLAIKIYRLHPLLHINHRRFSMHALGRFISTLINDPSVSSSRIWALLQIPVYGTRPPLRRKVKDKQLSEGMVELLNNIALGFAHCESRTARVALRNVIQCIYYLRLHNAPITSKISGALAHISITREIQRDQFVGQERLRYVISMIDKAEGKDIANLVDEMVYKWRGILLQRLGKKRAQDIRERNILRVGPID